jgi:trans-aconitate 2-methyltransferase
MHWDVSQYARYADERGRPFLDLVTRIGALAPRRVVDLGCGPGNLTALLASRWPTAKVEGVDSSVEMIARAAPVAGATFRTSSIEQWQPDADVDVVVSNAALQWVPGHAELLRQWLAALPSGAWLAWQVPGNFGSPSHRLMRSVASSDRWAPLLGDVLRHDEVLEPTAYAALLQRAGWSADVWETTYLHILTGPDPVLEWVRGTGLRPVLAALSGTDAAEFETEYAAQLRSAYPSGPAGTIFGFRRVFAVGHKP